MYEKLLGLDTIEAKRMESTSKGYAYAYQVLGTLYLIRRMEKLLKISCRNSRGSCLRILTIGYGNH